VTTGLKIPVYSPQATNPAFAADHENYPFLLRMDSPDNVNVGAMAEIFKRFLWKRIAILTSNTDYGKLL
jgi:ABC-type branched-subunit amino acid transport system substrate-binding protein